MIGTDIQKRETRDLWVAIAIALSLGVYHLLFNIISFLQYISHQYYQWLNNLLFLWILVLLWVAYRRWRNAVFRQRELRNILASISTEVIMVVDSHRRIQMVNESVNIFGYSPEEVINKTTDLLYLDRRVDKNRPTETLDSINKMGFHIGQVTGRKRTGETFPLEIMTSLLKGSEDVVVVIKDITERKRIEDALRKSEERYRVLVENARDIVFKTDETGYYTFVNPAMIHVTGYEKEELIGKQYTILIRSDMRNNALKFFGRQLVKGLQNSYSEYPIITKDGQELWFGQNTQLIVEDDHIIGFQAVARDITERRRLEEDLKRREAMLNEMGAIAKVGGWEFDAETKKQVWTKEVYRIHEVDENFELTVEKGIEFYAPSSRVEIERAVQSAIDYGEPFDVELEIITAKGNHRWVHASGKVDPERGIKKIISGTFQDITERRQAEEKIRHMAYHDSLTGLSNRKLFSDRLRIVIAQAQRNQKKVGIAMLDLDNFKGVNDTLGHDVGDLLLKEAAERLSAALRKGDTIARFGGDEFALILPEMSVRENAIQVAKKIVDIFCNPFLLDTHKLVVTASIGIAVYPDDGKDEEMLLKNADIAMYQAKQGGRARYQLYKKT